MVNSTQKPKDKTFSLNDDDVNALKELQKSYHAIKSEISKVIIGQEEAIEKIFICMLSQGHALLMGVPGLAKTLLVNSIAQTFLIFRSYPIHARPYAIRCDGYRDSSKQRRRRR